MADPIQTLAGTDNATGLKDKFNQNFRDRFAKEPKAITNADSPYYVLPDDEWIRVDASSGNVTLKLEAVATAAAGRTLFVEGVVVTFGVDLDPNASEQINGASLKSIGTAGRLVVLSTDNTAWYAWYMDRLP